MKPLTYLKELILFPKYFLFKAVLKIPFSTANDKEELSFSLEKSI